MNKKENTYCKRCNVTFECMVNDIANCQCSSITLANITSEFISKTKYSCLCANCLTEINTMIVTHNKDIGTLNTNNLIEGLHYYMDGTYFVFTELYHYLKGRCCENGCRHCAYGNKKE